MGISIGLFVMLLLVSLNYWSTNQQNKALHKRNQKQQQTNDNIQQKLIETTHMLKEAEKRATELKKSEADLEKCFKEKLEMKSNQESNESSITMDDLVEKASKCQEHNNQLKVDNGNLYEKLEVKESRIKEIGRQLIQLRNQVNANKRLEIKEVNEAIWENTNSTKLTVGTMNTTNITSSKDNEKVHKIAKEETTEKTKEVTAPKETD